ncbi:hypothetical protein RRSWK_03675 [Rhodopirellula sp. SWK7]|nr:hypothetical protein RRSWK_03675 [Rhodopirellula sp. SWK7]
MSRNLDPLLWRFRTASPIRIAALPGLFCPASECCQRSDSDVASPLRLLVLSG